MQEAQLTQAYLQEHGIEREILLPDSKDIEQYGYLAESGGIMDRKIFNKLMLANEQTPTQDNQGVRRECK